MRENDFIRALRSRTATPADMRGIGDDCCEWTPGGRTCLSVDTIVEGTHFLPGTDPALVGRKAAAAALSDLAAAGARPVGAVVALTRPAGSDALPLMVGLTAELERHGCALLGGDTTTGPVLTISVTVWGEAVATSHGPGRLLNRHGAQMGDLLVVTGPLGGSLASGRHLRPEPRFAQGQWFAQCPYVHACMDISDGLATDVPRLADLNGLGSLLLPAQVPVHDDVPPMSDTAQAACCDGEDFELLAAVAPEHWPALQLAWPFDERLAVVGWLVPERTHTIEDAYNRRMPLPWGGYEHA